MYDCSLVGKRVCGKNNWTRRLGISFTDAGSFCGRQSQKVSDEFLGTLAVAKVSIEHPSAKLVYRPGGVSDIIVRQLQETGNYRVIDWMNLEQVLFRRNLEWSDLQSNQNVGKQIQDVLFNDYFLMGTVTSYGENMEFSSSAFSKSKEQVVDATIEMSIKDALTNEIVASAQGHGEARKKITQTLGFGAAGGIDTVVANSVLDKAIMDGVHKLTVKLAGSPSRVAAASSVDSIAALTLPDGIRILCIFLEEEDGAKGKTAGSTIGLSVAEHAMAKELQEAGATVLTADDVVNHAFSISGGENLLSGGWASEQDFMAVENLLQARSGLASYAIKVGKTAGADLVVSGTVNYQVSEGTAGPSGTRGQQGAAYLAVKAIDVERGDTVHLVTLRQNFLALGSPSGLNARTGALEIGARKAAREIILSLQ